MTITQITENKKQYLDLLLLADEQESMIDRYLERGELFVLEDERLIGYLCIHYSGKYTQMTVGTGDVPGTLGFYRNCGFKYSHRIKNFFTDNYDHPIVEEGILLEDMVYLKRRLE